MPNKISKDPLLLSDADIAGLLGMSRSWVRKQRFLRRREQPHFFEIDSVMIGSVPRYRRENVRAWIDALPESNHNHEKTQEHSNAIST